MRFSGTHRRPQPAPVPDSNAADKVVRRNAPRCPLSGKLSYETPAKARKVLKASVGLRSMYRCGCGAWHLTHLRHNWRRYQEGAP